MMDDIKNITFCLYAVKEILKLQLRDQHSIRVIFVVKNNSLPFFDRVSYENGLEECCIKYGCNSWLIDVVKRQKQLIEEIAELSGKARHLPFRGDDHGTAVMYCTIQKNEKKPVCIEVYNKKDNVEYRGHALYETNTNTGAVESAFVWQKIMRIFPHTFKHYGHDDKFTYCFLGSNESMFLECTEIDNIINKIIPDLQLPQQEHTQNSNKTSIPRTIDEEKLKHYFKSSFKGIGSGNVNYFSWLIGHLSMDRTSKDFAKIALMCYDGNCMNNKPTTWKAWYQIFCDCVGLNRSDYDNTRKLRKDTNNTFKNQFSYLL